MQKRELFNIVTYYSGITFALKSIKNIFINELPILAYHRVLNIKPDTFNCDLELISADRKTFEKQLAFICKNYQTITFDDLDENYSFKSINSKPPIILTFDDGFIDNYDIVFPILKYFDSKATFFVVTNVVDRIEPLWFDLLAFQIMSTNKNTLTINDNELNLTNNRNTRRRIIANLLLELRPIDNESRINILNEISIQLSLQNTYSKQNNYLSWDHIKEMKMHGMEFGSHSRSHPILASMQDGEIYNELLHSKTRIETELNHECKAFSYPVGGYDEYNSYALEALSKCGYKFACTYEPGINKFPLSDPFQLNRIHIERYTSQCSFRNAMISSIFSYK